MSVSSLNAMVYRMSAKAGKTIVIEDCIVDLVPAYPDEIKREDLLRRFYNKYGKHHEDDSATNALNVKLKRLVEERTLMRVGHGIYSKRA